MPRKRTKKATESFFGAVVLPPPVAGPQKTFDRFFRSFSAASALQVFPSQSRTQTQPLSDGPLDGVDLPDEEDRAGEPLANHDHVRPIAAHDKRHGSRRELNPDG